MLSFTLLSIWRFALNQAILSIKDLAPLHRYPINLRYQRVHHGVEAPSSVFIDRFHIRWTKCSSFNLHLIPAGNCSFHVSANWFLSMRATWRNGRETDQFVLALYISHLLVWWRLNWVALQNRGFERKTVRSWCVLQSFKSWSTRFHLGKEILHRGGYYWTLNGKWVLFFILLFVGFWYYVLVVLVDGDGLWFFPFHLFGVGQADFWHGFLGTLRLQFVRLWNVGYITALEQCCGFWCLALFQQLLGRLASQPIIRIRHRATEKSRLHLSKFSKFRRPIRKRLLSTLIFIWIILFLKTQRSILSTIDHLGDLISTLVFHNSLKNVLRLTLALLFFASKSFHHGLFVLEYLLVVLLLYLLVLSYLWCSEVLGGEGRVGLGVEAGGDGGTCGSLCFCAVDFGGRINMYHGRLDQRIRNHGQMVPLRIIWIIG